MERILGNFSRSRLWNCREDNAPNFRFCGMCGTSLELATPRRTSTGPPVGVSTGRAPPFHLPASSELSSTVAAGGRRTHQGPQTNRYRRSPGPQCWLNQPAAKRYGSVHPHGPPDLASAQHGRACWKDLLGLNSLEPEQPKTARIGGFSATGGTAAALGEPAGGTYTNWPLALREFESPEPCYSSSTEVLRPRVGIGNKPSTQDATPEHPRHGRSQAPAPSAEVAEEAPPRTRAPALTLPERPWTQRQSLRPKRNP